MEGNCGKDHKEVRMEEYLIEDMAAEAGFTKAKVIKAEQLVFNADFRRYCEENLCGNYGDNYSCPPDCGSPEQMEARAREYENALVFQTVCEVEDMNSQEELARLKKEHNKRSRAFIRRLKEAGLTGLPMLAGPCDLCRPCRREKGEECAYPEQISSCLSAYCVQADKMAEACDMTYWGNGRQISYFSLFLYY